DPPAAHGHRKDRVQAGRARDYEVESRDPEPEERSGAGREQDSTHEEAGMIESRLPDEYLRLQQEARKVAREVLGPICREIDEKEYFPMEVYRKLGQQGYLGAAFPEEYGGGGSDLLANAIIKEELAVLSPGFAMSVGTSAIFFAYNVLAFGTEE